MRPWGGPRVVSHLKRCLQHKAAALYTHQSKTKLKKRALNNNNSYYLVKLEVVGRPCAPVSVESSTVEWCRRSSYPTCPNHLLLLAAPIHKHIGGRKKCVRLASLSTPTPRCSTFRTTRRAALYTASARRETGKFGRCLPQLLGAQGSVAAPPSAEFSLKKILSENSPQQPPHTSVKFVSRRKIKLLISRYVS